MENLSSETVRQQKIFYHVRDKASPPAGEPLTSQPSSRGVSPSAEKIPDPLRGVSNVARRIAEIPKVYRKTYEKAVAGSSKPAAIKAFCLECCMWQKNEIINCTSLACPLFGVRPFVKHQKPPKNEGFSPLQSVNAGQPA